MDGPIEWIDIEEDRFNVIVIGNSKEVLVIKK